MPSTNDWEKNLKSIINRIPKKFPNLASMNANDWFLTLNGTIIDKNNYSKFGKLLSTTKSPATIQIVNNNIYIQSNYLWIEYKAREDIYITLKWTPSNPHSENEKDWNENYVQLINDINTKFKLHNIKYTLEDNDECEIECGLDLLSMWQLLQNNTQSSVAKVSIICSPHVTVNNITNMHMTSNLIRHPTPNEEAFEKLQNKMFIMHKDMVNMEQLYQTKMDMICTENKQAMTEMNEMKEKYDSLKSVMEQTEEKSEITTEEMQKLRDEKHEMEMQLKVMVNNDETVNELNDKIKILEQKLKDTQKDDNINMSSTQSNEIIEEIVEQTEINDDINNSVTNKSAVNEHNEQKLDIVADTMKETEIMNTTNKDDKNILNKMVIDMKENLNKIVNNCILQLDIATKVRKNCISLAEKAEALTDMSSFTVPYTKIKLSKDSECCDVAQAAIQLAFEGKIRCSIKLNVWKQMKNEKLIQIDLKNATEKEYEQIVNNQVDEMINDIKRSML